ncbi:hypothetical protein CPB83DRAFT_900752 [Crepidotus variabilis]|uniref:Uncharacterized protein n=1 Tax=Crepidotus variabilis TaxID=179855 RepID=A0A9P6BBG4_9AGAR|nr:hypothetical protein CPB83DRAFT_900752 [Crepidotus variabilis]
MWKKTARSKLAQPPITDLKLQGVSYTNRAIKLDFGALHFQLAYLTHISIQVFSRDIWEASVAPKKKTVGVLASLRVKSYDIFKHVFYQDRGYLVVRWIESRSKSLRDGLACEVIRGDGGKVWGGVGVYTVSELFFDAGICPYLSEQEVFDSPSQTARLCEALWTFADKSHCELLSLLCPCIMDGLLAPDKAQQLDYARWLHVYAKDRSKLTPRMADLCDRYKMSTKQNASSMALLLTNSAKPSLGHLVFGQSKWNTLALGEEAGKSDNPLTEYLIGKGLIDSPTNLDDDSYNLLWDLTPLASLCWRSTFVARGIFKSSRQIWSITPIFPDQRRSRENIEESNFSILDEIEGKTRQNMLFSSIVNSPGNSVAIGPLEYCEKVAEASEEEINSDSDEVESDEFALRHDYPDFSSRPQSASPDLLLLSTASSYPMSSSSPAPSSQSSLSISTSFWLEREKKT